MSRCPITASEWEVMRVIWAQSRATSAEVTTVLSAEMNWTAATIKTLIGRLRDKGIIQAHREGRRYIYSPCVTQRDMIRLVCCDIVDKVCDREIGCVIDQLVQTAPLSQRDLERLMGTITDKKKSAPEVIVCQCVPGQCSC